MIIGKGDPLTRGRWARLQKTRHVARLGMEQYIIHECAGVALRQPGAQFKRIDRLNTWRRLIGAKQGGIDCCVRLMFQTSRLPVRPATQEIRPGEGDPSVSAYLKGFLTASASSVCCGSSAPYPTCSSIRT